MTTEPEIDQIMSESTLSKFDDATANGALEFFSQLTPESAVDTTPTSKTTTIPSITLTKTSNRLHGLVCYEYIDMDILDKLINSDLLKTTFNNKVCRETHQNEKEQLIKYKKLIRNGKCARIEYKRSKNNPFGRCNPVNGLGLFNIRREVRQTLAKRRYTDIDIKNAHPTMLYNIMDKNGYKTILLKSYIENRQEWFDLVTKTYACSEEAAKNLFIRYLYGGGFQSWKRANGINQNDEEITKLQNFWGEVAAYQKKIVEYNPLIAKLAEKIKEDDDVYSYNLNGTTTSYFLQEYEVRILEQLYSYCNENGLIPDGSVVLCADGLMIETEFYTEKLLTTFEQIVAEQFGFELTFLKKEMKQDFLDTLDGHVKEEDTEPSDEEESAKLKKEIDKNFKKMVVEFEKTHAKIINKSSFAKNGEAGDIIFYSKQQLVTSYEHLNCGTKKKFESFINKWLKYPDMRKYDDIGIYPNDQMRPDNHFNIWRAFRVDTLANEIFDKDDDALQLILNHIKVLCNHDPEITNYLIKWIANALLYPEYKSTCIVLISDEGAGKTWLMQLFQSIFGKEKILITTTPSRDVWGNFNGLMPTKYIVNLNELSKRETVESEEKILGLITDDQLTINSKGTNQFIITSYHRFMITTNKEDGGITTRVGDRRKVFIRSSDEYCVKTPENAAYFDRLFGLLDNSNAIMTFVDYLYAIDDVPKNFLNCPIPATEYQKELQEVSRTSHDLWLENFAQTHTTDVILSSFQLFESYKKFCDNNGFKYDGVNSPKLCLRIKHLFKKDGDKYIITIHTRSGNKKQFVINELRAFYRIDGGFVEDTSNSDDGGEDGDTDIIEYCD